MYFHLSFPLELCQQVSVAKKLSKSDFSIFHCMPKGGVESEQRDAHDSMLTMVFFACDVR